MFVSVTSTSKRMSNYSASGLAYILWTTERDRGNINGACSLGEPTKQIGIGNVPEYRESADCACSHSHLIFHTRSWITQDNTRIVFQRLWSL